MTGVLSIWTVYDHPRDMPHQYVARRFEIEARGPRPTDDTIQSTDLELVRRSLQLRGLTCLPREPGDERHIIESWL